MSTYSFTDLSDADLLHGLHKLVAQERKMTAAILAHIAEIDERRLYVPAGYSSMHAYCVRELRFSDSAAFRRIRAARTARKFPEILVALASGSVHLTAVLMLVPYLSRKNLNELLDKAAKLRKDEFNSLLAQRFGRAQLVGEAFMQLAPAPVELMNGGTPAWVGSSVNSPGGEIPGVRMAGAETLSAETVSAEATAPEASKSLDPQPASISLVPAPVVRPVMAPRVLLQLPIDEDTQKKLRYAQALLSHAVPSGDLAKIFDRALDALIEQVKKKKFGAAARTRERDASPTNTRHIPAQIRRAVWERDGGRCTFVGKNGHLCGARRLLEFDHITPVARGGQASVAGVRLRCRTHNQYEAERVFGKSFIADKRRAARQRSSRTASTTEKPRTNQDPARVREPAVNPHEKDVIAALRSLGCRAAEARRAASHAIKGSGSLTRGERARRTPFARPPPAAENECPCARLRQWSRRSWIRVESPDVGCDCLGWIQAVHGSHVAFAKNRGAIPPDRSPALSSTR